MEMFIQYGFVTFKSTTVKKREKTKYAKTAHTEPRDVLT